MRAESTGLGEDSAGPARRTRAESAGSEGESREHAGSEGESRE